MGRQGRAVQIILAAVSALSVLAAGAAVFFQVQERQRRMEIEQQLSVARAHNTELTQQLRDLQSAKQRLEAEMADVKNRLVVAEQHVETERHANTALMSAVEQRQQEIARLSKDLDQLRAERDSLSQRMAEAEALRQQLADLQQAKADLESKVLELSGHPTVELDPVVIAGGQAPGSGAVAIGADGSLQGQVLVVNREFDFIVLNLGRKQGLEVGQEFSVVRGSEVLGRVKVEKLYEELSAAAILPDSKKDAIREGDAVKAI